MLSYVAKHSKQRKTTKVIKLQWIASIWCQKHQTNAKLQKWSYFDEFQSIWRQNYQNIWVRSQNYKSNQITMDCIDLMSKQSKMLSYVVKHSKLRKTTKEIKLQWIASIWHQNDLKCWDTSQNYKCDHITMNLHRFDVKTIKNVELRRKTFNNAKLRKWSNYNALHRFDVKTIKNVELRQNIQNYAKLVIKLQWIASIWHQNDLKCWDTSQNYKCDHITMNLHRFDVKTITTTHNYEIDQIIMHCINLTSKRSKKLSYVPKLQKWSNYNEFASIWCQNDQKCWVTS